MPATKTFWWTEAPFLRLLAPLMVGIAAGWYLQPAVSIMFTVGATTVIFLLLYTFLRKGFRYRLRLLPGVCIMILLAVFGAWLVRLHDVRNQHHWFGHNYQSGDALIVALDEMLVTKANSFKANVRITGLVHNGLLVPVSGKAIVYLEKSTDLRHLAYGSRILLRKPLQPVQNSGNPGAFDYRRYCLFQDITHQVFLRPQEFRVLPGIAGSSFQQSVIRSRLAIVGILKAYIHSPREQGFAEALLIGYKDDLDKGLVQAYSNTGVVHVIAISGLHLGLIYGLLLGLVKLMRIRVPLLRFAFLITGLWAFTLLAGAQPSVVRSAVMFTCMALGGLISRRASPLNTLAFSAFGLLCFDPFWLWDLGFQLSYTAVAGILIFYKPFYHLLYFPNKAVDAFWQLVALTLTAQILTFPVSLFHFHQFPLLLLMTNLIAVPLSSIILFLEILLCAFHFVPFLAQGIGWLAEALIRFLNGYILRLSALPFAVWDGFLLSALQVVVLYAAICAFGFWLFTKNKKALVGGLAFLLCFAALRASSLWRAAGQRQMIVYHVPRHRAVDFISGRKVFFAGDPALMQESFERAFHLRPARILFRVGAVQYLAGRAIRFGDKVVSFYDSAAVFPAYTPDLLVVSGKAKLPRQSLGAQPVQVVLDATVPRYRVQQWRRFCDSVGWQLHDVRTDGAFVERW